MRPGLRTPLTTVPGVTRTDSPTSEPPSTMQREVTQAPDRIRIGLVIKAMSRLYAWLPVVRNVS